MSKVDLCEIPEISVYFNKPKRAIDLAPLISDIRNAKRRLVLVSAWFTNANIAEEFARSTAETKIAIFNGSDLKRNGGSKAVEIIRQDDSIQMAILGGESFEEGVMHHKFIICDTVLWCGSFNFTYQALKNYENLIRMNSPSMAYTFFMETARLFEEWRLWCGVQFASSNNAFRCGECGRLYTDDELGEDRGSWKLCKYCRDK